MKKVKLVGNYLLGLFSLLLLVLLTISFINKDDVAFKFGNYSLLEVNGKSMYPLIKNGDLIAIDRSDKSKYDVGDIVSCVMDDGSIITHEIIKTSEENGEYHYFTKGVNNIYQDNDYIEIKQIIGEYKGFRIPLVGYVVRFANTMIGYLLLVIIPLGIMVCLLLKELIKEFLKKRGEY